MAPRSKPTTYDHLRSKKKPVTRTVPFCLDDTVAHDIALAEEARDAAVEHKRPVEEIEKLEANLDRLRKKARTVSVDFKFRSMKPREFDSLLDEHPPTKEQKDAARKAGNAGLTFNPETYPPALVAASLIEPDLTVEDVTDMWTSGDWNHGELNVLFFSALDVNQNRRVVNLPKASSA